MKVLLRLIPYIKNHRWAFVIGMLGLMVARLFEAAIPMFVKQGIDNIELAQSKLAAGTLNIQSAQDMLVAPALAIAACVVLQIVVTIGSRILIRRIGVYAAFDLRNQLYQHLQLQGPGFYNRFGTGDLMARAINDINLIRQIIASSSRMTMVVLFTAIASVVAMLNLSVPLTLAVVTPLPVISVVAYLFSKQIYQQSHKVQTGFSELSNFVQENLNGIRTVQSMAQEANEIERFSGINQNFANDNLRLFTITSSLSAIMPALAATSTIIIIAYGSVLVGEGEITLGTLVAFFAYLALLLWPVREIGPLVTQWQRGASGTARLFEILDHTPEIQDTPSQQYPHLSGHISVRNLSYQYSNKNKLALDNINFDISPGESVAILGRVGSGKSTLLRLFVRLLAPSSGDIILDGHPISGFPLEQLREEICLVLQDPFLFADSLGDNISYDNNKRDVEEVWRSADAAALRSTIEAFPEGLETIIGERGMTLSGGQKQRTALARGLIRMTPILILDDCFSAVDTETEEHILAGLKSLRASQTTLLVSNRVSTARHADKIIVLEAGKIVEMGSHEELLGAGGFYADLEEAQSNRGKLLGNLNGEQS